MEDNASTSKNGEDSFAHSNINENESFSKTDQSFGKISSIDKLKPSKSRDLNTSAALR